MPVLVAVVILGLGAALTAILSPTRRGWAAVVTGGAAVAATMTLVVAALRSGVGFHAEADLGALLPHADLVLRLTPISFLLVLMTSIALVASLSETPRLPRERGVMLIAAVGSTIAACSGNAVLLAAGLDVVAVATLLGSRISLGRRGRASVWAFGGGISAAVLVAVAAVELQSSFGTSGFATLPLNAMNSATTVPWALAGAYCLAAPLLSPSAINSRVGLAWASIGYIPTGIAVLVHLNEAAADGLDLTCTVTLAALGGAVALGAAIAALRCRADASRTARWLCIASAGPAMALAGLSGNSGRLAFAAACIALELWAITSAVWAAPHCTRGIVAATLICVAMGFGIDAAVLSVAASLEAGGAAVWLLAITLAASAAVSAAAAVAAAWHVMSRPADPATRTRRSAGFALIPAAAAAVVPGVTVAQAASPLSAGITPPNPLTLAAPWGVWPGGYLVIAVALVAAGVWAASVLLGIRLGSTTPLPPKPLAAWTSLLRPRRTIGPAMSRAHSLIDTADGWLLTQPQFGIAVLAAFAALILIR